MSVRPHLSGYCALALMSFPATAFAQDSAAELAAALANPLASMISVPFTFDYNDNLGADEGTRQYSLTMKPVIPVELGGGWNMISRTIIPLVGRETTVSSTPSVAAGTPGVTGFGNITQSLFFSPAPLKLKTNGEDNGMDFVWGIGPIIGLPTASDPSLGTSDWTLGPTGVFLFAGKGLAFGALLAQSWSVGGSQDINSLFFQPFFTFTNNNLWTFGINSESTYDWNTGTLVAPIHFTIQKLVKSQSSTIAYQAGLRYYAEDSPASAKGWGARFQITLLFPK